MPCYTRNSSYICCDTESITVLLQLGYAQDSIGLLASTLETVPQRCHAIAGDKTERQLLALLRQKDCHMPRSCSCHARTKDVRDLTFRFASTAQCHGSHCHAMRRHSRALSASCRCRSVWYSRGLHCIAPHHMHVPLHICHAMPCQ